MTRAQLAKALVCTASALALAPAAFAQFSNGNADQEARFGVRAQATNPAVVVTIENAQPSRGTFLTPVWMGIHDGSFDSYDGGSHASVPLGGNEIEALAEDGNNGPITETFERLLPDAPQVGGLTGPSGPLAPGDTAAVTLSVNPETDRYFSYGSMIIPSNDFFVANGNPLAHQLFDDNGQFVGEGFTVSGDETNDAGTEVNDEIASNVAFLAQSAPDTGLTEGGVVVTPAPGFAAPGTLTFPNGVLNHPVFGQGDFNDADDALLRVSFRYVDLGRTVRFESTLTPDQEVGPDSVDSDAVGRARAVSIRGQQLLVRASARRLSGPLVAAHLHLGREGVNGPVIVDLGSGLRSNGVSARVTASDLTDAFDGNFDDFLGELAAGNVYLNLHTAENPGGEVRGQVELSERQVRRRY